MARVGTLAVAAMALAGCVTPVTYGPIGTSPYGYRDSRNPDGSFTVLVVANNAVLAHEFWDRRAAELCGASDYQKNIFRAEIPVVQTTGYAVNAMNPSYGASYTQDVYGNLILEGYLRCNEAQPAAQQDAPPAETPANVAPAAGAPSN